MVLSHDDQDHVRAIVLNEIDTLKAIIRSLLTALTEDGKTIGLPAREYAELYWDGWGPKPAPLSDFTRYQRTDPDRAKKLQALFGEGPSPEELRFDCQDCDIEDVNDVGEYAYMVHDDLWLSVGMGTKFLDGMLCIGCLENRLGRELTPADFNDARMNTDTSGLYRKSDRLLSRQGHNA